MMKRKKDHKKIYISIFIVAIMVLSTFGFILGFNTQDTNQLDYNNFEFRAVNNLWQTEINDKEYTFYSHPSELTMHIPSEIIEAITQASIVTLTFDPNIQDLQYVDVARFELDQLLSRDLGKIIQSGVTEKTGSYNLPIATCSPQPGNVYITFTQSNESNAFMESNCITITTNNPIDYIHYSEKIIYTLLGVIS